MAQGKALTEDQVEAIQTNWLLTENGSEVARLVGIPVRTVNDYIAKHRDELRQLRHDKRPDLADRLGAAIDRLVTALFDGKKIADASLKDTATAAAILIDKRQLLTGEATERHEHRDVDAARADLARRVDELAARRRAKGADLVALGGGG